MYFIFVVDGVARAGWLSMKASSKYVDTKHRSSINNSSEVVGQLYLVLRDAEGKVIDWFHRLDADPNW